MNVLNKLNKTYKPALALLAVIGLGVSATLYALTDAGTVIANLASVDYQDANGNSYTATSNEAGVTVGAVYGAEIAQDKLDIIATPGQTVYISYTITNTGNTVDNYDLNFFNEVGGEVGEAESSGGTSKDGTNLAVYLEETINGQPDAGEVVVVDGGTDTAVTVEAGETASLVVAVTIPSDAVANDEIGVELQADSLLGGSVVIDDVTASNGEDGAEESVQGLITVTTGAVLIPTKSSAINAIANTITYTLTVKNNGGDASDVDIFDAIPIGTTFVSASASGLLDRSGISNDDLMYVDGANAAAVNLATINIGSIATTNDFSEPATVDMNGNGTLNEDAVDGIMLRDVILENGVTVSVTYVVSYDPVVLGAGAVIKNIFCVGEGLVDTSETLAATGMDTATCSNTVIDTIPQTFGVYGDDTDGDAAGSTVTVGDDEDNTDHDGQAGLAIQHEVSGSVGETVSFVNEIFNTGNGDDNFNLKVADSAGVNTFPDGTTFTYFDASGSIPLADNNGDGIPDTGIIGANSSIRVTIKAQLPVSIDSSGSVSASINNTVGYVSDNKQFFIDTDGSGDYSPTLDTPFTIELTATSIGDGTEADTVNETLGVIIAAVVDLANAVNTAGVLLTTGNTVNGTNPDSVDGTDGTDDTAANLDNATVNVHGDDSGTGVVDGADDRTATYAADVGGTVFIDLAIANEAGSSGAFTLDAGYLIAATDSTAAEETFTPSAVPPGWTLQFLNDSGAVITSTPSIPAGNIYHYRAEITVSSNGAQALGSTGYFLAFGVNSASDPEATVFNTGDVSTGVSDLIIDLITINSVCSFSIIPNGVEQLQPGGTKDFEHTLANEGNSTKTFEINSVIDGVADSWATSLFVDTDDDDLPDTLLAVAASNICYFDDASNRICDDGAGNGETGLTAADSGASAGTAGVPSLQIAPGQQVKIWNRIFAPATAADGSSRMATISVGDLNGGCATVTATDTGEVIFGQVRLDKTVAVDPGCFCNGTDNAVAASGAALVFAEIQPTSVLPGQCAIWRLMAENEGTATAIGVVINDAVTRFSVLADDSALWGTANPSGVAGPPASRVQLCQSEVAGALDCSDPTNALSNNFVAAEGLAQVSITSTNVTFGVGAGATTTAGGSLVSGDKAAAQFCVQVQ